MVLNKIVNMPKIIWVQYIQSQVVYKFNQKHFWQEGLGDLIVKRRDFRLNGEWGGKGCGFNPLP